MIFWKTPTGCGYGHRYKGGLSFRWRAATNCHCPCDAENAPIIILDEATAFADPDNESRVQAAFSKLSEGKTVIMIAHRLSTVTNVDQIFVIQDGQVAECGNSRELLAKDGIFSHMWKNYQTSVQWKVTKEVQ